MNDDGTPAAGVTTTTQSIGPHGTLGPPSVTSTPDAVAPPATTADEEQAAGHDDAAQDAQDAADLGAAANNAANVAAQGLNAAPPGVTNAAQSADDSTRRAQHHPVRSAGVRTLGPAVGPQGFAAANPDTVAAQAPAPLQPAAPAAPSAPTSPRHRSQRRQTTAAVGCQCRPATSHTALAPRPRRRTRPHKLMRGIVQMATFGYDAKHDDAPTALVRTHRPP